MSEAMALGSDFELVKSENHEDSAEMYGTLDEMLSSYLHDYTIEDNTVIGYVNEFDTFKEILEKMKLLGFAFSVRDSDVRQKQRGKSKKGLGNSEENEGEEKLEQSSQLTVFYQLRAMPIKFFGLPFTIERTTHYQCAYGCKYYKSRTGVSKTKHDDSSEVKPSKKKRKVGSKKMGCLAKMTIKHITVYPDYQLGVESDWRKKKKLIESLRKDLTDGDKNVKCFQRFYLSVSVQSSHNHPPIIVMPKRKVQRSKSLKVLVKQNRFKESNGEAPPAAVPPMNGTDWNVVEMPSSSLNTDQEQPEQNTGKTLNLQDENFFHTLVKFPNTPTVYEQVEYKPVEIEIEMRQYEQTEGTQTIEVYEYQPTIQDIQTIFKEKLKRLYTLCSNCSNGNLLLRLAGDLEQVENQLSIEVGYGTM